MFKIQSIHTYVKKKKKKGHFSCLNERAINLRFIKNTPNKYLSIFASCIGKKNRLAFSSNIPNLWLIYRNSFCDYKTIILIIFSETSQCIGTLPPSQKYPQQDQQKGPYKRLSEKTKSSDRKRK